MYICRLKHTRGWGILRCTSYISPTSSSNKGKITFNSANVCRLLQLRRSVTFESMAEDVLQDGNKVNELWRWVIYGLETGVVKQSLHWKPEHKKQIHGYQNQSLGLCFKGTLHQYCLYKQTQLQKESYVTVNIEERLALKSPGRVFEGKVHLPDGGERLVFWSLNN